MYRVYSIDTVLDSRMSLYCQTMLSTNNPASIRRKTSSAPPSVQLNIKNISKVAINVGLSALYLIRKLNEISHVRFTSENAIRWR